MTTQIHSSTALVPPHHDEPVPIDDGVVTVVRAIWAQGWQTAACCQDVGEAAETERALGRPRDEATSSAGFIEYYRGWAWLKMPRSDAFAFLAQMADDDRLREAVTTRRGGRSWRMFHPVIWSDGAFVATPFVQIYFPKEQITEIERVLIHTPSL
ncbi:hypothetical protein BJF79_21715 [Actinomadura sp. CNU-125]|uniref:hypothetical protein n=1 Tax=Actinomadura sp. CNU-125 TaxID=1904961 RepID=UPI00096828F9|nr:hypothetical protein [Actinomadura sp. CNU-125]OLT12719.1 hypothetical protein BJF79_21715 [Actinomadura sp. CNU-125]